MLFTVRHSFLLIIFFFSVNNLWSDLYEKDASLDIYLPRASTSDKKNDNIFMRRLNFQERMGNFLVFYDFAGRVIYLQFKKDKWDFAAEPIAKKFIRGVTYYIEFNFLGPLTSTPLAEDAQLKLSQTSEKKVALGGKYRSFKRSSAVDLRF